MMTALWRDDMFTKFRQLRFEELFPPYKEDPSIEECECCGRTEYDVLDFRRCDFCALLFCDDCSYEINGEVKCLLCCEQGKG